MNKDAIVKEAFAVRRKMAVLEYTRLSGSAAKSYRYFGVPKSTFYKWKKAYDAEGEEGLYRKKPIAWHHPR